MITNIININKIKLRIILCFLLFLILGFILIFRHNVRETFANDQEQWEVRGMEESQFPNYVKICIPKREHLKDDDGNLFRFPKDESVRGSDEDFREAKQKCMDTPSCDALIEDENKRDSRHFRLIKCDEIAGKKKCEACQSHDDPHTMIYKTHFKPKPKPKYKISTGVTCPNGYTNIYEDDHIKGAEKCNEALKVLKKKHLNRAREREAPLEGYPKGCWISSPTMIMGKRESFSFYNRHKNPKPTENKLTWRKKFAVCRLIPTDDEKKETDYAKKNKQEKEEKLHERNEQIKSKKRVLKNKIDKFTEFLEDFQPEALTNLIKQSKHLDSDSDFIRDQFEKITDLNNQNEKYLEQLNTDKNSHEEWNKLVSSGGKQMATHPHNHPNNPQDYIHTHTDTDIDSKIETAKKTIGELDKAIRDVELANINANKLNTYKKDLDDLITAAKDIYNIEYNKHTYSIHENKCPLNSNTISEYTDKDKILGECKTAAKILYYGSGGTSEIYNIPDDYKLNLNNKLDKLYKLNDLNTSNEPTQFPKGFYIDKEGFKFNTNSDSKHYKNMNTNPAYKQIKHDAYVFCKKVTDDEKTKCENCKGTGTGTEPCNKWCNDDNQCSDKKEGKYCGGNIGEELKAKYWLGKLQKDRIQYEDDHASHIIKINEYETAINNANKAIELYDTLTQYVKTHVEDEYKNLTELLKTKIERIKKLENISTLDFIQNNVATSSFNDEIELIKKHITAIGKADLTSKNNDLSFQTLNIKEATDNLNNEIVNIKNEVEGKLTEIVQNLTGIYETIETNNITITSIKESYNSYKSELSSIKTRLRNIKPKLIDNIKQKIDNINDYQYVGLNYHGLNKNINNLDDLLNILTEHNTKIKTIKNDEEEMNNKYETKIEENNTKTIEITLDYDKTKTDKIKDIEKNIDNKSKLQKLKNEKINNLNESIKYDKSKLEQLKRDIKEMSIKYESLQAQTITTQSTLPPHNNFIIKAIPGNEQITIIWDEYIVDNYTYNYDLYIFDKNDVKKIKIIDITDEINNKDNNKRYVIKELFNGIHYGIKIKRKRSNDSSIKSSNILYAIPLSTIREDSIGQTTQVSKSKSKSKSKDNSLFRGREFEIKLG